MPPAGTSTWRAHGTFEGVLKPLVKNSSWIKRGARWLTFKRQTTTVFVLWGEAGWATHSLIRAEPEQTHVFADQFYLARLRVSRLGVLVRVCKCVHIYKCFWDNNGCLKTSWWHNSIIVKEHLFFFSRNQLYGRFSWRSCYQTMSTQGKLHPTHPMSQRGGRVE